MILEYENKIAETAFLSQAPKTFPETKFVPARKMLFWGDNIDVLKFLLQNEYAGKIDLIYIDPPFATNNVFTSGDSRTSTISNSTTDKIAYEDNLVGSEFVEFIRLRLILLRELLSEKGSIYLHIDYKIGHYIKIMMDEVFGQKNFRNDIARIKCNPKNFSRKAYGNIKDSILFYSKTSKFIWNDPRTPFENNDVVTRFNKVDSHGKHYTTVPVHAPGETKNGATGGKWKGMLPPTGRHWRTSPDELEKLDSRGLIEWSSKGNPRQIIYAEEKVTNGKKIQDVWTFKDNPYPSYPTEKNLKMLECIISASSNNDSFVLDCFCGSGTTLIAAEKLGRNWIGIDKSDVAIKTFEKRFEDVFRLLTDDYKKINFV
ncbi:MAG: DNA methyltransferase [Thermoguttaceae bacterium]